MIKKIFFVTIFLIFSIFNQTIFLNNVKGESNFDSLDIFIDDGINPNDWVSTNQNYNYTINYYNPNCESVKKVLIKNILPSEVNFVDASPGFNKKDNWVKWFFEEIPSKSGGCLWINVTVDSSVDKIIEANNTLTISSNETFDNSTFVITLIGNPEPLIVKEYDNIDGYKIPDCIECFINYSIEVVNPNLVTVNDIWITDNISDELEYVRASLDFFVDYDNGWVDWYKDKLYPNESINLWLSTSIKSSIEPGKWIVNTVSAHSTETLENKSTSIPILYKSAKIITYSKWMFKGWNSLYLKNVSVKDNDYSIENIFSSVWDDIEIIFENSTGKNFIKDETGNTLSIIIPDETYMVKMKNATVFYIGSDPHENRPPVAKICGPYYGKADKNITFNASQSYDPDSDLYDEIVGYRWDFLDNGTYSDWFDYPIAKFAYDKNGTYKVKLQVKDKFGLNDSDLTKVYIGNQLPIADAGGPYEGVPNENIELNASKSNDYDGKITGYKWDFNNDGTYDTDWLTNPITKYTYNNDGDYTIKLLVKDNQGETSSQTTTATIITLNNPPSKPTIDTPNNGTIDTPIVITLKSTDSDGDKVRFYIDWGDDNIEQTDQVSSGFEVELFHTYEESGLQSISVYAEDESGARSSTATSILLINTKEENKKEENTESGFPFWIIILIGVVAAVSVIVVLFIKKKGLLFSNRIKPIKDEETWSAKDAEPINEEAWDTKGAEPSDTWD